jgi:hypothetical protein|tara:strand:+ start:79 stop:180 length:102 start_codon:yes stop_codon:yes gene_type:complete
MGILKHNRNTEVKTPAVTEVKKAVKKTKKEGEK